MNIVHLIRQACGPVSTTPRLFARRVRLWATTIRTHMGLAVLLLVAIVRPCVAPFGGVRSLLAAERSAAGASAGDDGAGGSSSMSGQAAVFVAASAIAAAAAAKALITSTPTSAVPRHLLPGSSSNSGTAADSSPGPSKGGGRASSPTHSRFFTTAKLDSNAVCEIRGPAAYGSGESLLGADVVHAASSN